MKCLVLAAVGCMLGCTPNLVVGTREPDAALIDAEQPAPQVDAGRPDAAEPVVTADAGTIVDAGSPAQPALDASVRNDMQSDGGPECASNTQCTDTDEPFCKLSEGQCVECLSDADCDPNELCEDDGDCGTRPIPCTSALQCVGSGDPVCHSALQVCVECQNNSDCPGTETCQPDNECD